MNRTIKFRAWDKNNKIMYHKVLVGNCDANDPNYTAHAVLIDSEWVNFDEHSDIVLMQFTGVHDKNGKEIYEGDIFNFEFNFEALEHIARAVVVRNKFGNLVCVMIRRYANIETSPDFWFFNFFDKLISELEVIGNVHENPELINNAKNI